MNDFIKEKKGFATSGWIVLIIILGLGVVLLVSHFKFSNSELDYVRSMGTVGVVCFIIFILLAPGLVVLQPNQTKVLLFFGHYVGTIKTHGLRWTIPFFTKRTVSTKIRNFETTKSKVNDNQGNPIQVAGIIVWRIVDTAKALFEVNDCTHFVHVQSEAALRNLVMKFPYDSPDDSIISLITHTEEISELLKEEVQSRLNMAGVEIIETRISHLAYAAEIAVSMLKRQQASAIIDARKKIVDGAVGMVESALTTIEAKDLAVFNPDRKAQLVSNLLVVLCSEQSVQPTIETNIS